MQVDSSNDGAVEAMEAYDNVLPPPEPAVVIDEDVDPWWTAEAQGQQDAGKTSGGGANSGSTSDGGASDGSGGGGGGAGGTLDHQPAGSGVSAADDIKLGKDVP